jgi:hypothetical protein
MNIEEALFPAGSPVDGDAFSPAAFKNLQANAIGILLKMQTAYRQRVIALQELETETSATKEELEEAETRAENLKMQLDGMARQAAEQKREMQQLVAELAMERKARADVEERIARGKAGIAINVVSEGSMVSEDLGVEEEQQQRRTWRKSGGTVKSDVSYDTDDESAENESVFSRSRSPTIPPGALGGSITEGPTWNARTQAAQQKRSSQQTSTLQRLFKGVPEETEESGVSGCRNCRGQDAGVAWGTVSLLRDENRNLKRRIEQLESAVEHALDAVNGVGLLL